MKQIDAAVCFLLLALLGQQAAPILAVDPACVPSATHLCMSLDMFASETGYYNIANHTGSSPDIHVTIGQTYTFDQSHPSNWYHPVGFAYEPDGAHGSTWGGAELDEVEGLGELLYKINGVPTTCADAGDTGLGCYEPEFFYPQEAWIKKSYRAELTITQAIADASHGGVIYYFCHIHSKMSGKIIIHKVDGSHYYPAANPLELALYSPVVQSSFDTTCGTTGVVDYSDAHGTKACAERFVPGAIDTAFDHCLQAIDCAMNKAMHVPLLESARDNFLESMIPHHLNAINMAKLVLKLDPAAGRVIDRIRDLVNVQIFQVHQFRNILEAVGDTHSQCMVNAAYVPLTGNQQIATTAVTPAAPVFATCVPSATRLCMSLDMFASETGYYNIANHTGSSPDIHVTIGQTYTFDQSHPSNWYHPVGFAYEPDGNHGSTWGGAELPEVEGPGELLYKIDGAGTTCANASDAGLDCYELEFFYPQEAWTKKSYRAELTITQAIADASHGGVIYYFCHIHSKMSGKIIIHKVDGSHYYPAANPLELALYSPVVQDPIDASCGTTGVAPYTYGQSMACSRSFLCGDLDTVSDPLFGQCLQGVDCAMNKGMFGESTPDHHSPLVTFLEQMIPHHLNAVNMAKLLMKTDPNAVAATAGLEGLLWDIVNVQNFQVHLFRNYLGANTGNTGIPPGEVCTSGATCAMGYVCTCATSGGGGRRNLLFAAVPKEDCTCEPDVLGPPRRAG